MRLHWKDKPITGTGGRLYAGELTEPIGYTLQTGVGRWRVAYKLPLPPSLHEWHQKDYADDPAARSAAEINATEWFGRCNASK